jgi:hypothetical protein
LSEDKLTNFLKSGKDWSRFRTSIPGVFILKLPAYKRSPTRLAVELNPVDLAGNTKKRRGLVIRSAVELDDFKELFQFEKLSKLLDILDSVNPITKDVPQKKGEDIIEL